MTKEKALEMLKFEKVEYTPTKEIGYVSSVNDTFIHVKFESQLNILGWEDTTSQACNHEDLKDLKEQYHGWITNPDGRTTGGKSFFEAVKNAPPSDEVEARMEYVKERMEIVKKNMGKL